VKLTVCFEQFFDVELHVIPLWLKLENPSPGCDEESGF